MSTTDLLHQTLLELHYGLLSDDEAARWRERFDSDAKVAAAWATTLKVADQFAEAARLESLARPGVPDRHTLDQSTAEPPVRSAESTASPPGSPRRLESKQVEPKPGQPKPTAGHHPPTTNQPPITGRPYAKYVLQAIAATVAVVLVAVVGRGIANLPARPRPVAQLEAVFQPGRITNQFQVRTMQAADVPLPTTIAAAVKAGGVTIFEEVFRTNRAGVLDFALPVGLHIPRSAQLELRAAPADDGFAESSVSLPLPPTRGLTCLTTDKPFYRPGETIHYRSLTLDRRSMAGNFDVPVHFELLDPSGALVPGSIREGVTRRGVGNGQFTIPTSLIGGQYTLVARSLDDLFPEEKLTVQVQQFRAPRFKKDLEFERDSYGPGEAVSASLSVSRAEGGPLAGAKLTVKAMVDGQDILSTTGETSATGTFTADFTLPEFLTTGEGQLSITIDDGGTRETAVKTIPIQLGTVDVRFYPEGGDLVSGLENRVYFAARNTLGDPIDIAGQILDAEGAEVARLETVRDGLGSFRMMPRAGERYTLKVTQPADVTNSPELPRPVTRPLVLETLQPVIEPDEPLRLSLRAHEPGTAARVTASCRGDLVAMKELTLKPGQNEVELALAKGASGVIRVTVATTDTDPARPIAERLVYRRDDRRLHIEMIGEEKLVASPGDPVKVTLQVKDENGRPAPSVLGVAVVDDAVLSLAEKEQPSLRTRFYLGGDLDDPARLEDLNFYLEDDPAAANGLDLLLGTQGWRRFVDQKAARGEIASDAFHEQLERLVKLGEQQPAALSVDNLHVIQSGLDAYSQRVGLVLMDTAIAAGLLLVPALFFLAVVLVVRRLVLRPTMCLLLALAVGWTLTGFSGCGSNDAGREAGVASDRAAGGNAAPMAARAEESMADATGEMAEMPLDGAPLLARPDEAAHAETEADEASGRMPADPTDDALVEPTEEILGQQNSLEKQGPAGMGDVGKRMRGGESALNSQQLSQLLRARGIDAESIASRLLAELRFPIREYAHRRGPRKSDVRNDFTETVYWHPMLMTDSQGQATFKFQLSDSVTTFRVLADAHTGNGRLGSGGGEVVARLPFQIETQLPFEVTAGDRIDLPVAIINTTTEALPVSLRAQADSRLKPTGPMTTDLRLGADDRQRQHFGLEVTSSAANSQPAEIGLHGQAGKHSDAVRRSLRIVADGYPAHESFSGLIDGNGRQRIRVPEDIVPGSLAVTMRVYPSPLADMQQGMESILREPHGCFEQTTSSNYPNTMALRYLRDYRLANPAITRRAKELLDRGYRKLVSFECTQRGYEWFGQDPGHEALTAFGLMQFQDMAAVYKVDTIMMVRTARWLLSRRDGQGGFRINPRFLHTWSAKPEVVNAYILWALTEAGQSDLATELDALEAGVGTSRDAYFLALAGAALMNADRKTAGIDALNRLRELQADDGHLAGVTTVVASGGLSLKMETTALAALAWLKSPQHTGHANRAVRWIIANRQGSGGFGSTQATVLALKALVRAGGQTSGGKLTVRVEDKSIGTLDIPAGAADVFELTGLAATLKPGDHTLELQWPGGRLPYSIDVSYYTRTPQSDANCPVTLVTELADRSVDAGATTSLSVALTNTTDQDQPMTVAAIGLPAGLEAGTEQLNELREAGVFDYYEIRNREVICYWRSLNGSSEQRFKLTLTAAIPGRYTGPASRAYLYYTAEQKHWTEPVGIEIVPR